MPISGPSASLRIIFLYQNITMEIPLKAAIFIAFKPFFKIIFCFAGGYWLGKKGIVFLF